MSIIHLDTGGEDGREGSEAEFVAGLRQGSADALERAYEFLRGQSDSWAMLRAEVLCEGRPASELSDALASSQQADGGLPIGTLVRGGGLGFPAIDPSRLSSVETKIVGTLEGLLQAADAKALAAPWVEAAARAFETFQSPDGAFRVPTIAGSSDPEATREAEIFWTGMVGGILGRTVVCRPSLLEAAGDFIAERFEPEAVEQGGYSALLAYAHFFTNVAHDLSDEALQWCGRALEKGFRSRQLDAVATVRVLLTCDAQAMPGATFDVAELLSRILEEQAGDGGFAELSFEGPASRTTPTFDAMLAIVRLCSALEV